MSIIRSEIEIPDHDVLRKIGGGAYGEVWMARGVTGALRAVKIVWRGDFEDERGFEREFEGILKFEPISRDHPGFVNILHVGRGTDEDHPFYYYVMELGDDILTGREINPVEYEARTLRSDLKAKAGRPLEVEFCLDVAEKLSEALRYLHGIDLAHRDIKPANVIFVDGKAKLADIGLVAARGQQTFVGTEGFVPPEGPGTGQADVYSLGKVLYEMATGKDRLQFPELPDSIPEPTNRKQWLALNQVICSVCEPKLSKRTLNTAKQLNEAIKKIQEGKKVRAQRANTTRRVFLGLVLLALLPLAWLAYSKWLKAEDVIVDPPVVVKPEYKYEMCSVQFITTPLQAKVFENGIEVDEETPTAFRQYPPGTKVLYRFEKEGYMSVEKEYEIPDKEYHIFQEQLAIFLPPLENEEWIDPLGVKYFPRIGFHESGYIQEKHYLKFLKANPGFNKHQVENYSERGVPIRIVLIDLASANAYARWIEDESKMRGLLRDDQYILSVQEPSKLLGPADLLEKRQKSKLYPTRCVAKEIPHASLTVTSSPSGARVFVDGEWLGVTPMTVNDLRPGSVTVVLRKEGYKFLQEIILLADAEEKAISLTLKENNGAVFNMSWTRAGSLENNKVWTNSLGTKMVQFDPNKMVATWETQLKNYRVFLSQKRHRQPKKPGFPQTDNQPVVGVSKQDAIAFCKWLTEKERKEDRIGPYHEYRLPTDKEWSQMCGLLEEKGSSPAERYLQAQLDPSMRNMYPWGSVFPPRKKVANLADQAASRAAGVSRGRVIREYNDGFVNTAMVGSLLPNELGIHDLSGNVYEWVSDSYSASRDLDVARGGCWASHNPKNLKVWSRFPTAKEYRDNLYGFRYVLVNTAQSDL